MRLRETAAKWKSKSTTGHRQRERETVKAIMETESGGDKVEKKRVIGVVLVVSQGKQNEASFPAQGCTKLSHYTHTHTHTHTIPDTNPSILKPSPDCTHWREFQIWLNVDAAHMSSQVQHSHPLKGFQTILTDSLLTNDLLSCSCLLTKIVGKMKLLYNLMQDYNLLNYSGFVIVNYI